MKVLRIAFIWLVLVCFPLSILGQEVYRDQELTIKNENDVYTFRDSDKYYSNGLIVNYRWISSPGKFLIPERFDSTAKLIIETEFSQKFFTPKFLRNEDVQDFDRPYAGTLSGAVFINYFKTNRVKWRYGLDLTLIGPASGAGDFQIWYHRVFGFPTPRGWDFQVPNELTLNFVGEFQRQFFMIDGSLDLMATTSAMLGTGFTNAKQMLDFRIGRLSDLNRSTFSNGVIGKDSNDVIDQVFFFAGMGLEYVAHNITIQGSLWNNNALHTEQIVPWVRHMRFGLATNTPKASFKITYNWLGPEVKNLSWHSYVGFELNIRFAPGKQKRNAYN